MRVSGRKVADIVCLLLAMSWWQVGKTKPGKCRAFNQEAWSSGSIWISGVVDQNLPKSIKIFIKILKRPGQLALPQNQPLFSVV